MSGTAAFDAAGARVRCGISPAITGWSRGEFIWNRWQVPTIVQTLDATSGFVEGRYKVSPGFFVASRIDYLGFNELTSPLLGTRTWDAPVTRLETGAGYYIRRNLLAKGTYQHNWRDGGPVRTAASSPRNCISGCDDARLVTWRPACWRSALCSLPCQRAAWRRPPWALIRGRVDVRRAAAPVERRPNVNDLGMHAPPDMPDLRRSVVYLESAPSSPSPIPSRSGPRWISGTRRSSRTCSRSRSARPWIFRTATTRITTCSRFAAPALRPGPLRGGPFEVRAFRSSRHRPRVLRNPLAHERVHSGVQPPVFRRDLGRRAVTDRPRASRPLYAGRVE